MMSIRKLASTIRNNWKKSVFGVIVLSYGYSYTKDYFQTQELMRVYCKKAASFGNKGIAPNVKLKTVTVILNPNANKRKATEDFEKYCAPILHLSGVYVNLLKTEFEGHAKKLVEDLNSTDAIVVAGGDGTLCEVVTGLLRRTEENTSGLVPLGILPLGIHNSFAKRYFSIGSGGVERVKSLAEASMAIVEEVVKPVDVMRIETTENEFEEPSKPIYALSELKLGAYRDAEVRKENYWYLGSLRKYATYVFSGYKNNLLWNFQADINFSPPCEGCSNCFQRKLNNKSKKWFQRFEKDDPEEVKVMAIKNPDCSSYSQEKIETLDMSLSTRFSVSNETPKLHLNIGPKIVGYTDFVKEGWNYEQGQRRKTIKEIDARQVEITPLNLAKNKEAWFSIDNDNFEVHPVRVTLLPKCIQFFCKKELV